MTKRCCAVLSLALVFTAAAWAQPVLDGNADEPLYGANTGLTVDNEPIAVITQDGQTGYGDADRGRPDVCNGSELDALYAVVYGDTLYMTFAGNYENNGNRLHVFFDTRTGGQQQLTGTNPDKGVLLRMGDDGTDPGLKFKGGFEADFWLSVNCTGENVDVYCDFAELFDATNAPTPDGWYVGGGVHVCGGPVVLAGGDDGAPAIGVALDNRNTVGVDGGYDSSDGTGVYTGFEIAIPLTALDSPTGDVTIVAFIGSSDGSAISNQILGGLAGGIGGNLAGGGENDFVTDSRLLDLSNFLLGFHSPVTIDMTPGDVGACCVGDVCTITTASACSGTYLGDNTSCDANPCDTIPSGQCCIDDGISGICEVTTFDECTTLGGTWTEGLDCSDCACLLDPRGACCYDDNCVDDMLQTECEGDGGEYAGDFVMCDSDPCQFGIATPYLAGSFQIPTPWTPDADPMTETEVGSGIWTITMTGLTEGRGTYKITDGTWDNTYPSSDSWVYVPVEGEVTFTYDTNLYDDGWAPNIFRLGQSVEPGTWTAVGNFQDEVGAPGDWNNAEPLTAMVETPAGSGIYLFEATGIPAGDYAWKAVVTGTWDAISWDRRAIHTADMAFTIGADTDTVKMWVDALVGVVKVEVIPSGPVVCLGDSNCDGAVSWRDIDFFVAAMNDNVQAWEDMFLPGTPACPFANNDVNEDGTVSWRDIDPLVAVMNTTCQ